MRDDQVRIFQQLSTINLEIRKHGPTPTRIIHLATLSLALGQPDQAIEHVTEILDEKGMDPIVVREAVWICVLSLCLKEAILEGNAAGAPGVVLPKKGEPSTFRQSAIELLDGIPEMDADEVALHRKLKQGFSMTFIEELIAANLDY